MTAPTASRPSAPLLACELPPCCAIGLLWLGAGVSAMALFPALRGVVGGFGWMPLFLLLMPLALLLASVLARRGQGRAVPATMRRPPRRIRARRQPTRRRVRRGMRWQIAALLAGFGLPRG